jgi:hypothetical protein
MMPDIRRALLKRHREELEALNNEQLLGLERLEQLREDAIDDQVESLEYALEASPDEDVIGENELQRLRDEAIAEQREDLRSTLEDTPDDELLGATLDEAR